MKNRDYLFIKRQEGKICNNRHTKERITISLAKLIACTITNTLPKSKLKINKYTNTIQASEIKNVNLTNCLSNASYTQ